MKFLNRFSTHNRYSQRMKFLESIKDMLKSEKNLSMFSKAESDKEVYYFTFERKIEGKVFNFIISISEHSSGHDFLIINVKDSYGWCVDYQSIKIDDDVILNLLQSLERSNLHCRERVRFDEFIDEYPKDEIFEVLSDLDLLVEEIYIEKYQSEHETIKSGYLVNVSICFPTSSWDLSLSEVLREVASIKKRLHKMGLSCKFWWDHNEPKESNGYTRNGFSLKLERI